MRRAKITQKRMNENTKEIGKSEANISNINIDNSAQKEMKEGLKSHIIVHKRSTSGQIHVPSILIPNIKQLFQVPIIRLNNPPKKYKLPLFYHNTNKQTINLPISDIISEHMKGEKVFKILPERNKEEKWKKDYEETQSKYMTERGNVKKRNLEKNLILETHTNTISELEYNSESLMLRREKWNPYYLVDKESNIYIYIYNL